MLNSKAKKKRVLIQLTSQPINLRTSGSKRPDSSRVDKQLDSVQSTNLAVKHLRTAGDIIKEAVNHLREGKLSKKTIATNLDVAARVNSCVGATIAADLNIITPVPSAAKAASRLAKERQKLTLTASTRQSVVQLGRQALKELKKRGPTTPTVNARKKRRTSATSRKELTIHDLPPLSPGSDHYSPSTVFLLLTTVPTNRIQVGALQKLLISSGRVPVKSQKALRDLVHKYKGTSDQVPLTWGAGRRPIMPAVVFQQHMATILAQDEGLSLDPEDTERELVKLKQLAIKRKGDVPVNTAVAPSTVRLYHSIAMQGDDVCVPSKALDKTENHHTAERSLISAMTFALVVLATVYRVGESEKGLDFPDKTTDGARIARDLVLEANDGVPMFRVPPHRMGNMDDQTAKIYC